MLRGKRVGDKAEKLTIKRLGGRQTPASGALDGAKGDGTVDASTGHRFRVEHKATEAKSLSLKEEWLLKISQEAAETGRDPALAFTFVTGDGKPRRNGSWVAIPDYVFKELINDRGNEG